MAVCAAKHHARKFGMEEARYNTLTGGGKSQGVGKFIQGSGAGDAIVWIRNMDTFGVNGQ